MRDKTCQEGEYRVSEPSTTRRWQLEELPLTLVQGFRRFLASDSTTKILEPIQIRIRVNLLHKICALVRLYSIKATAFYSWE